MQILLLLVVAAILIAGCGSSGSPSDQANVEVATVTPGPPPAVPSPTPEPVLAGFTFPIEGGCLPQGDQLLPNAPRIYRNGFHEGLDLYESDNCTAIRGGTPVVAAKDGTVIRADVNYTHLTAADLESLSEDLTSAEALDTFRGRQVWIDHGSGVVTRYAHLSALAPGIAAGVQVTAGQVVAYVGESGTPESITNPGSENHLHFELRIGDSFLGANMDRAAVRQAYERLFSP